MHEPVMHYATDDEYRVGVPAEVCDTCSDFDTGHLVPASFCVIAKNKLSPEPWA